MGFRIAVLTLGSACWLSAQTASPPVFQAPEKWKLGEIVLKTPMVHIHPIPRDCKGQPDHVFGKSGTTYDACIGGKQVCSKEKVTIPQALIAEFDAHMVEHKAAMAEFHARRESRAQTTGAAGSGQSPAIAEMRERSASRRRATSAGVGLVAAADPAPPVTPVAEDLAREITAGTSRADLIARLGQPYMKVSGEFERFTYLLTSGNSAKFELENGKVTAVKIVEGQ